MKNFLKANIPLSLGLIIQIWPSSHASVMRNWYYATTISLNCNGGEVGIMGSHSNFLTLGCSLKLGKMTVKKSFNIYKVIYLLNQTAQFNQLRSLCHSPLSNTSILTDY